MVDNNKTRKRTSLFIILGAAAFVALALSTGSIGDKIDNKIADAETDNAQLRAEVTDLKEQLNATITILKSHELILQQHDMQIQQIANNTNIIANWGAQFSQNIDNRVSELENKQ